MADTKPITFRVRRFDPDVDSAPHWDTYTLNVPDGMTVLEALHVSPSLNRAMDSTVRMTYQTGMAGGSSGTSAGLRFRI